MWWHTLLGIAAGMFLPWLIGLLVLWRATPDPTSLRDAPRFYLT